MRLTFGQRRRLPVADKEVREVLLELLAGPPLPGPIQHQIEKQPSGGRTWQRPRLGKGGNAGDHFAGRWHVDLLKDRFEVQKLIAGMDHELLCGQNIILDN